MIKIDQAAYAFSKTTETGAMKSKAEHLINCYIGSSSATPINLPGQIELQIFQ